MHAAADRFLLHPLVKVACATGIGLFCGFVFGLLWAVATGFIGLVLGLAMVLFSRRTDRVSHWTLVGGIATGGPMIILAFIGHLGLGSLFPAVFGLAIGSVIGAVTWRATPHTTELVTWSASPRVSALRLVAAVALAAFSMHMFLTWWFRDVG